MIYLYVSGGDQEGETLTLTAIYFFKLLIFILTTLIFAKRRYIAIRLIDGLGEGTVLFKITQILKN